MRVIRSGVLVELGARALSGCAVFDGTPTAAQQKTIGKVAITFKVCVSQRYAAGSCRDQGNSGNRASYRPSQLWIGFRVPSGTTAPTSFTSTSTGPANSGTQLTFTSSSGRSPGGRSRQRACPSASTGGAIRVRVWRRVWAVAGRARQASVTAANRRAASSGAISSAGSPMFSSSLPTPGTPEGCNRLNSQTRSRSARSRARSCSCSGSP